MLDGGLGGIGDPRQVDLAVRLGHQLEVSPERVCRVGGQAHAGAGQGLRQRGIKLAPAGHDIMFDGRAQFASRRNPHLPVGQAAERSIEVHRIVESPQGPC